MSVSESSEKINIEIFLLSLMSVPESNEKYPPGAATARSFVKRSVEVLNQLVHGRVGRAKAQPVQYGQVARYIYIKSKLQVNRVSIL